LPPLVSFAPKIAQEDTASVSPCTHVPALAPAPARRLCGRTTFPLPAPFPFAACGALLITNAFLRTNVSELQLKLLLVECIGLLSTVGRGSHVRKADFHVQLGFGSDRRRIQHLICKHSGAYCGERLQICDMSCQTSTTLAGLAWIAPSEV
jgi:hypothetical protein